MNNSFACQGFWPLGANKSGFNPIIFYFTIHRKLSIVLDAIIPLLLLPYTKVTGCLSVCVFMFAPKNLGNR